MDVVSPSGIEKEIVYNNTMDINLSKNINKLNKIYGNNVIINGLECGFDYDYSSNLLKVYLEKGSFIADNNLFFLDNSNIFELDLTNYINEERYIFLIFYLKSGAQKNCSINKRVNIDLIIYDFDSGIILDPSNLIFSTLYFIAGFFYFDKETIINLTPNYKYNKKMKIFNNSYYLRPTNNLSIGFNNYIYSHYFPI